jgi:hypothetical protein
VGHPGHHLAERGEPRVDERAAAHALPLEVGGAEPGHHAVEAAGEARDLAPSAARDERERRGGVEAVGRGDELLDGPGDAPPDDEGGEDPGGDDEGGEEPQGDGDGPAGGLQQLHPEAEADGAHLPPQDRLLEVEEAPLAVHHHDGPGRAALAQPHQGVGGAGRQGRREDLAVAHDEAVGDPLGRGGARHELAEGGGVVREDGVGGAGGDEPGDAAPERLLLARERGRPHPRADHEVDGLGPGDGDRRGEGELHPQAQAASGPGAAAEGAPHRPPQTTVAASS